jgi:hypothetical protein
MREICTSGSVSGNAAAIELRHRQTKRAETDISEAPSKRGCRRAGLTSRRRKAAAFALLGTHPAIVVTPAKASCRQGVKTGR